MMTNMSAWYLAECYSLVCQTITRYSPEHVFKMQQEERGHRSHPNKKGRDVRFWPKVFKNHDYAMMNFAHNYKKKITICSILTRILIDLTNVSTLLSLAKYSYSSSANRTAWLSPIKVWIARWPNIFAHPPNCLTQYFSQFILKLKS